MVDVGNKEDTKRRATASGKVSMSSETIEALKKQELQKGDVLGVARVAGIQAAKKTSDLIPLCHSLAVNFVSVDFRIQESHVEIETIVEIFGKTGVEMEALCGVSTGLLCAWDMVKSLEKDEQGQYPSTQIREIQVLQKRKGEAQD